MVMVAGQPQFTWTWFACKTFLHWYTSYWRNASECSHIIPLFLIYLKTIKRKVNILQSVHHSSHDQVKIKQHWLMSDQNNSYGREEKLIFPLYGVLPTGTMSKTVFSLPSNQDNHIHQKTKLSFSLSFLAAKNFNAQWNTLLPFFSTE